MAYRKNSEDQAQALLSLSLCLSLSLSVRELQVVENFEQITDRKNIKFKNFPA